MCDVFCCVHRNAFVGMHGREAVGGGGGEGGIESGVNDQEKEFIQKLKSVFNMQFELSF